MATISVVVFSIPKMKHLAQCLESVQWADAITVRHLGDGGKAFSTEEVKRPSSGGGIDWFLYLWGEERVEAELREELEGLRKRNGSTSLSSYRIPVRSRLLGDWAEGSLWGPSPALRLRREARALPPGWWDASERKVDAGEGLLRGWIADYSLVELSAGVDWVNRCSSFWAARAQAENRSFSPANAVIRSLGIFARLLWMNGVFSRGLAGWTLSALAAYTNLLSGAKLWEARTLKGKMKNEK